MTSQTLTTAPKPRKRFGSVHASMLRSWKTVALISIVAYSLISWLTLSSVDTSQLRFRIDITPLLDTR